MKALKLITSIVLTLSLSTACAKTDSEPETAATDNSSTPVSVTNTAPVPSATPPTEKAENELSQGMHIPVDGTSLESFEQSLETIKAKATEAEYESLTGAIGYLMVYDIGARRDRAKLAQRLNGLTGEEILGRVHWDPESKNTAKKTRKQAAPEDQ